MKIEDITFDKVYHPCWIAVQVPGGLLVGKLDRHGLIDDYDIDDDEVEKIFSGKDVYLCKLVRVRFRNGQEYSAGDMIF